MADLEASSALARRLSSAQYFAFVRRLVRAIGQCVIDADGIVGRHADDGVVAFFLTGTVGSESAAARACVSTARTLMRVANPLMRTAIRSPLGRRIPFGILSFSTVQLLRRTRVTVILRGERRTGHARLVKDRAGIGEALAIALLAVKPRDIGLAIDRATTRRPQSWPKWTAT
jgi:hypothetical protein